MQVDVYNGRKMVAVVVVTIILGIYRVVQKKVEHVHFALNICSIMILSI